MQYRPPVTATAAWIGALANVLNFGVRIAPRGKATCELLHQTTVTYLDVPLVSVPARKLSTKFAAAEARWMLAGDDRLEALEKYAPRMREFSDDGIKLAGAYGPRIVAQLDSVVEALYRDWSTRQAVISIWHPNPPPSKDIPCTIALTFMIRNERLHCHVFMRSSDVWLGLPYDTFSFSMVAARVACLYNAGQRFEKDRVELGALYLTAASSHLYQENVEAATEVVKAWRSDWHHPSPHVPQDFVRGADWNAIDVGLIVATETGELPWSKEEQ